MQMTNRLASYTIIIAVWVYVKLFVLLYTQLPFGLLATSVLLFVLNFYPLFMTLPCSQPPLLFVVEILIVFSPCLESLVISSHFEKFAVATISGASIALAGYMSMIFEQ